MVNLVSTYNTHTQKKNRKMKIKVNESENTHILIILKIFKILEILTYL